MGLRFFNLPKGIDTIFRFKNFIAIRFQDIADQFAADWTVIHNQHTHAFITSASSASSRPGSAYRRRRNRECKFAAASRFAFYPDFPVVLFDQPFGDGQSQTCSFLHPFCSDSLMELIENRVLFILRNTNSVVDYRYVNGILLVGEFDAYLPPFMRKFECIAN